MMILASLCLLLACAPDLAAAQASCSEELGQSAAAITAVCCAGAGCTEANPMPSSCSSPCAELLAPLARRCGDFLAEHLPMLTPLSQICLERDGGT